MGVRFDDDGSGCDEDTDVACRGGTRRLLLAGKPKQIVEYQAKVDRVHALLNDLKGRSRRPPAAAARM